MPNKDTEKKKILIIDDDNSSLKLFKLKLTLDGFEVFTASDGRVGLETATKENFDLIFLDIKIPELDGFEILKSLKTSHKTKSTPVVLLSNFDDPDMIEKGLSLGANLYLMKFQLTPEEISYKVKQLLNLR